MLKSENPVRWFELLGVGGVIVAALLLLCNRIFDNSSAKHIAAFLSPGMLLPRTDHISVVANFFDDWIVFGVNFVLYGTLGLTVPTTAALLAQGRNRVIRQPGKRQIV